MLHAFASLPADAAPPDVLIVGAGPAGITLALELDGSGLSVWLLEAGEARQDGQLQDVYAGTATAPHPPTTDYRRIGLGGTSSIWGGRCVPYDPIDFAPRHHMPGSGWPIAPEAITRHYPKAMHWCEAGAAEFTVGEAMPEAPETIAGLDGGGVLVTDAIERYSLPTDFGRRHRGRLVASGNVTVLTGGRCVALHCTGVGAGVHAITVATADGSRREVPVRHLVLATGGIEVARLLLASDPEGPGIGNAHDHVGRWYQCHFENNYGRLVPNGAAVQFAFERSRDGVYCRRKFLFTAAAQVAERLPNTAFRLHFPDYSDARHGSSVMSAIFLAKSFLIREYRTILQHNVNVTFAGSRLAHLRNVLTGLPSLAAFAWTMLTRRLLATRKLPYTLVPNADGSYPVEFNCEQIPQPDNRVTLDPTARDRHGLPRVRVHWALSEADIDGGVRAFERFAAAIAAGSAARLHFDAAGLRARIANSVPLGGHHIGTARMAARPEDGVVDADCTVFDCPNLSIASSAVFPTSSHANPTLTIVALAIRLAGHLRDTLGAR